MKATTRPYRAQDLGREHFENVSHRATTDDFLAAIGATRPTVTEEMAENFRSDAERFTRQ